MTSAGACPLETTERADHRGEEEAAMAAVAAFAHPACSAVCARVSFVFLLLLFLFVRLQKCQLFSPFHLFIFIPNGFPLILD